MEAKRPKDSITKMEQVVLASHANGQGRLFGGQLMSWLDITGAICARRHSGCEVVTAKADNLEFHRPAMQNDIVTITAKIIYAGTTSMEVRVCAYVEPKGGKEPQLICSSYFVYVAMDENGNKCRVPKLIPETKEEEEDLRRCEEKRNKLR
ncbi:MAG: acyl-CoA thioesterase [Clostridiaceae bacterium]|jgi:acyl-CoA hydrolase|nr:acyl-CoA thioesterase [Clostridiaceae bacterium]